jgi:hypothetical protein
MITSSSPSSRPPWRYPRARLEGDNPIVLRFPNGERSAAQLRVISVTGGLVLLPKAVDQGSRVRLMFVTETGSVLGGAEMLAAVSDRLQPFRFVSLPTEDQRRVAALIGRSTQNDSELAWIEKLRLASTRQQKSASWWFKIAGVIALVTVSLAVAVYLLH